MARRPCLTQFFTLCNKKNSAQGPKPKVQSGKNLLNLASSNFLGYITNEDIKVMS